MDTITFRDGRQRDWELFSDESYYGLYCVRCLTDKSFNSETSFHFMHLADAEEFKRLVTLAK